MAVFASLVVARLLTPMMAAYILKPLVAQEREPGWLSGYMRAARWCLSHRLLTMVGATVFFFGSLALIPLLPSGFIPPDDNTQTQVRVELPPGARQEPDHRGRRKGAPAAAAAAAHRRHLHRHRRRQRGGADPFTGSFVETRKATLTLQLAPRGEAAEEAGDRAARSAPPCANLPGMRFGVGLGGSNDKYVLALSSQDPQALRQAATAVERELRTIPGIGNVQLHRQPGAPGDRGPRPTSRAPPTWA